MRSVWFHEQTNNVYLVDISRIMYNVLKFGPQLHHRNGIGLLARHVPSSTMKQMFVFFVDICVQSPNRSRSQRCHCTIVSNRPGSFFFKFTIQNLLYKVPNKPKPPLYLPSSCRVPLPLIAHGSTEKLKSRSHIPRR